MAEDFDNHRRIFDRGDDLQGAGHATLTWAIRFLFIFVIIESPDLLCHGIAAARPTAI
jgi:hypothetical protein